MFTSNIESATEETPKSTRPRQRTVNRQSNQALKTRRALNKTSSSSDTSPDRNSDLGSVKSDPVQLKLAAVPFENVNKGIRPSVPSLIAVSNGSTSQTSEIPSTSTALRATFGRSSETPSPDLTQIADTLSIINKKLDTEADNNRSKLFATFF